MLVSRAYGSLETAAVSQSYTRLRQSHFQRFGFVSVGLNFPRYAERLSGTANGLFGSAYYFSRPLNYTSSVVLLARHHGPVSLSQETVMPIGGKVRRLYSIRF